MHEEAMIYGSRQYRHGARIPQPDEGAPRPTLASALASDLAFLLFCIAGIAAIAAGVAFAL